MAGIVCNDRPSITRAYDKVRTGADFGTVALSMSVDDLSRPKKGYLGPVFYGMQRVPAVVVDQAFSMKHDTEITAPFYVKDSNQWVVLKRLSRQSKRVTSFNDMKDQILQQLKLQKAQPRVKSLLDAKRKKSTIVVKADRYKSIAATPEETKKPGKKT